MEDSPNQFRHTTTETPNETKTETVRSTERTTATTPAMDRWLTPAIIGLGALLILGGVYLFKTDRSGKTTQLPDYSPVFATPAASQSPAVSPSPAESPTSTPSGSTDSESTEVAIQATPATQTVGKSAPVVKPSPAVKGATTQTTKQIAQKTATQTITVTPSIAPTAANTSTANLPMYQPVVDLPEYQPQFIDNSITVSLQVPSGSYSVKVAAGATVLDVFKAAQAQGLRYETQEFSGLGTMIVSINGVGQDNGKYWTYKINGNFASKGASQQTVNQGDTIVWTLS